jgi:hypothetical protein
MYIMKVLIVFYSRTGNTACVARRIAEELRSSSGHEVVTERIEELKGEEKRKGVWGYLASGFEAMKKRESEIVRPGNDPVDFDLTIVGTPVWAWNVPPATRSYCSRYLSGASGVCFFCTMGGSGDRRTFTEMERLSGKSGRALMSLREKDIKEESLLLRKRIQTFCDKASG